MANQILVDFSQCFRLFFFGKGKGIIYFLLLNVAAERGGFLKLRQNVHASFDLAFLSGDTELSVPIGNHNGKVFFQLLDISVIFPENFLHMGCRNFTGIGYFTHVTIPLKKLAVR